MPMPFVYSLVVVRVKKEYLVFEGLRKDNPEDQHMFAEAMQYFARKVDWSKNWKQNAPIVIGTFLRKPAFLFRSLKWGIKRLSAEATLIKKLITMCRRSRSLPKVRPFLIVVHNFMSPDELDTEEGKERLDACSFKLPVNGEMISMCEMNASGLRAQIDKLNLNKQVK